MNVVEKLDQPCSCTLVEVVIRVSHPFTLVSERQSDNCPLLVCKPILHTAFRVLSPCSCLNGRRRHYLPLHMRALAVTWNHGRHYLSTLSLTHKWPDMDLPLGTVHWSRRTNLQTPIDSCGLEPDGSHPTTISPIRFPIRASTTFEYLVRKALDTRVQRSTMVHMLVPKHSREEEVDVPLIEN